ncbi:MAG: DUF4920 domain-containing protein [Acidobacteriota bacterium]|nr:MAG: DUF4920 domain-containing protein [Acidobacteriota bacterium]
MRSSRAVRVLPLLVIVFVFTLPAVSSEETTYGTGVTGSETVKISALRADPEAFVGKKVRVEGRVLEVCPRRGCWIDLAGDKESQSIRFNIPGGLVVFPAEAKGKHALAEGVFVKREVNQKHAMECENHKKDAEQYRELHFGLPDGTMTVYLILGTGAVVR